MKKSRYKTVSIALSLLVAGPLLADVPPGEIIDHMDKSKYSSSEIKAYMKSIKGEAVHVSGKVTDVKTGRSGTRISLTVPGGTKGNYKVDVVTKEDTSSIHQGASVHCNGIFRQFNTFTLNGFTLIEGHCE